MDGNITDLTFTFLETQFSFPQKQCYYYRTLRKFKAYAEEAVAEYEEIYKSYKDYHTFAEKGILDGIALMKSYTDRGAEELFHAGIYSVSKDDFADLCLGRSFEQWENFLQLFRELNQAGDAVIKESAELRELRKNTRGRSKAVGFGMKGSIGAYALSGSLNALSGIMHSGANAVGNARTRAGVRAKLNELYKSKELLNAAKKIIYNGICNDTCGVLLLSLGYDPEQIDDIRLDDSMVHKVMGYCENFDVIPEDRKKSCVIEMLRYGAPSIEVYRLLDIYGDPDGSLQKAAEAFGLSVEFERLVKTAIQSPFSKNRPVVVEKLNELRNSHSTEDVKRIKTDLSSALLQTCGRYHIGSEHPLYKECWTTLQDTVDTELRDIQNRELDARTYRSIVFATLEDAELAQKTLESVEKITAQFGAKNSREQKELLVQLEQLHQKAPSEFKKDIQETINKLTAKNRETDFQERTFLNHTFGTKEDCSRAKAQYNRIRNQYLTRDCTLKQIKHIQSYIASEDIFPVVKNALLQQANGIEARLKTESAKRWRKILSNSLCCIFAVVCIVFLASILLTDTDHDDRKTSDNSNPHIQTNTAHPNDITPSDSAAEPGQDSGSQGLPFDEAEIELGPVGSGESDISGEKPDNDMEAAANTDEMVFPSPQETEIPAPREIHAADLVGTYIIKSGRAYFIIFEQNGTYYFNFVTSLGLNNHLFPAVPLINEGDHLSASYSDDTCGNSGSVQIYYADNELFISGRVNGENAPQFHEGENLYALSIEEPLYPYDIYDYPIYNDYLDPSIYADLLG